MVKVLGNTRLLVLFIALLAYFPPNVFAADTVIKGQIAKVGVRDGFRVQFNNKTGKILGVFDMLASHDDGMLFGGPDDISHFDFQNTPIKWQDFDILKSYVDLNDLVTGSYTLVLVPIQ